VDRIFKTVSFDSEKDADLLARIEKLEPGTFSQVARAALTAYFELGNGVTLAMVYSKLADVERKMVQGVTFANVETKDDTGDGETLAADIIGQFD